MGTEPTNPDFTPIPYTLQDRLNLQATNDNLKAIGEHIDEMKTLMTEHIKVQHAKLDEEVEELQIAEVVRKEKRDSRARILKYGLLVIGAVGSLAGVAVAFHLL